MENYFVSGTGLKMWLDGSCYKNPDEAIIKIAMMHESDHSNIEVKKYTGLKGEVIYTAKKKTEKCLERMKKHFHSMPRNCQIQHAYA